MTTPPRRLNKYELQERLGRGGMAEVWKAFDTQLHRYVAIKILHADLQNDPNFVARFEREAQFIASLHHPNIVKILDFQIVHPPEAETTLAYMIMDYVEGPTLAHYLSSTSHKEKFPSPVDLLHLFTPIGLAIDYAHQKSVIHRDLKPSNILLDRHNTSYDAIGEPILSDFGIAKLLGTSTSTLSGWWLGTPAYISPEQIVGRPGDERSDIYSLSVILYETCTGKLPFQGDNPTALGIQHVNATPIPPILINPNLPPDLTAVILRGLAKAPELRFTSASSLVMALANALRQPIPESVREAASRAAEMYKPTYISPARPQVSPQSGEWTLSPFPSPHIAEPSSAKHPVSSGSLAPSSPSPMPTPTPLAPVTPVINMSEQQSRTLPPPSVSTSAVSAPKQRRSKWLSPTIVLTLLLLAISIGSILLFASRAASPQSSPSSPPVQVVGQVYFTSSGQLNPDNSQGINDEVVIDLHNLPAPQPGKAYYAWLLGDKSQLEPAVTALGQLVLNHGNVSSLYQDTQHHRNLLLYQSRFLITEEDATFFPTTYSPDKSVWRYYAEIPQAASPKDKLHFTMLDHLRHLTSESPELKIRGLHGGLDMWFVRNTQKILEWANGARDDWGNDPDLLHRHIIRILDYLDGVSFVQKDAPTAGPITLVDPHDAQVPLLGPVPDGQDPPGYSFDDEAPPGYVYLVSSHLGGTVLSLDATPDQRALAAKVQTAIDKVKAWLEQAHQDAKQLLPMTSSQLAQPSTLAILDDMVTHIEYAYLGQPDPLTGQLQGGTIWISTNIQRMANFEVKPYASK